MEERGAAGEAVALLFSVAELFKMDRGESGDDLSGMYSEFDRIYSLFPLSLLA